MNLAKELIVMRRHQKGSKAVGRASAGSWLALLAATTLGAGANTLRAEVRARGLGEGAGAYRLVVQSYDQGNANLPDASARPVGSMQRAVTADELRQGVQIDLLQLRSGAEASGARPVVVAWVESGEPDLEFDARAARPQPGSVYGVARRGADQDSVQIRLDRVAV